MDGNITSVHKSRSIIKVHHLIRAIVTHHLSMFSLKFKITFAFTFTLLCAAGVNAQSTPQDVTPQNVDKFFQSLFGGAKSANATSESQKQTANLHPAVRALSGSATSPEGALLLRTGLPRQFSGAYIGKNGWQIPGSEAWFDDINACDTSYVFYAKSGTQISDADRKACAEIEYGSYKNVTQKSRNMNDSFVKNDTLIEFSKVVDSRINQLASARVFVAYRLGFIFYPFDFKQGGFPYEIQWTGGNAFTYGPQIRWNFKRQQVLTMDSATARNLESVRSKGINGNMRMDAFFEPTKTYITNESGRQIRNIDVKVKFRLLYEDSDKSVYASYWGDDLSIDNNVFTTNSHSVPLN